jgi:hypothetical protein
MNARFFWRVAAAAAMTGVLAGQAQAQSPGQIRVEGEVHDFTGPMTPPDPLGSWKIDGQWTLTYSISAASVDFVASLNMIRSDNTTRAAHTHHVRLTGAQVAPIANGYRISGTASLTSNGAMAGFSGSPVEIDLTGGNALAFASVKVRFGGAAAAHFGEAPLGGVVTLK